MNTLLPSSGLMAILKQPKENQFQVKVVSCYVPLHWKEKSTCQVRFRRANYLKLHSLIFTTSSKGLIPFRVSILIYFAKYQQYDGFYLLPFPPKTFCHSDNRSLHLCLKRGSRHYEFLAFTFSRMVPLLLIPHQSCWVHKGPEANYMLPQCLTVTLG